MKIFIFLNDCLLGENTTLELFFIFLKNGRNIPEKLLEMENKMEFNNLFLREETLKILNDYIKLYAHSEVNIVTNLSHIPLDILEIDTTNKINICNKDHMNNYIHESGKDYILITGDFWKNIKNFFKAKRVVYVGPYLVGKIIDIMTAGRTTIINRPYGIFTIVWDYFCNVLGNIFILWPLLFFLPSSSFVFWKFAFFFSVILNGFGSLWRHFLELETERKFAAGKKEVLFATNFIYLHHSTYMAVIISFMFLLGTIMWGSSGLDYFKALIYAFIYSIVHFLFLTRSIKEYILAKISVILILPIILQPTLLFEFFKIMLGR
jgi:hypothetical protein